MVRPDDENGARERRAWVLDTETKGTGAQMVPLDKVEDPDARGRSVIVVRERRPPSAAPAAPTAPRRFRVVDVMTRQVLGDELSTAATAELLSGLRSVVDVSIFVWDEQRSDWRELTLTDRKRLWALRRRG